VRAYRKLGLAAFVAVALIAATATLGSAAPTSKAAKSGGVYRVGWDADFGFTDSFDPTGEYLGDAWGIDSDLLIRTLVTYNHTAGPAGTKIVPDIATTVPKPTNGGKTYTFHLKKVKFGPPVNRVVTSKDFVTAMKRLASPVDGAQYDFYYNDQKLGAIKGFGAFNKGKAKTISGISTPNASTIVFTLTKPQGDFLNRMAMPATGPMPAEVTKCFEGAARVGQYGRRIIATGPYMIAGSDKGKLGCPMKPFSGFDGKTNMTFVRNPSYDPKTDSKASREALPDSFVFSVDTNTDDIYNRIKAGQLDDNEVSAPSKPIRQWATSKSLKSRLHYNSGDFTYYVTMNLTQPPFDDIHVRKAMNLIIDKDGLRKAWGGPIAGAIGTHIVPNSLEGNLLKSFDPYKTDGSHGDVAKAMAEIKKSKYDPGHTGKCTASACKNVLFIQGERLQDTQMTPIIQADAAKIGISFAIRVAKPAYPVIQDVSKNIPISERPRWGKDYADALTFFAALFTSKAIIAKGNTNYSLVGITPAIAKTVHASGTVTGVPNIDERFTKCDKLVGKPRVACWAALDKYVMLNVVPWVPYMDAFNVHTVGPKVTKWDYDQFSATTAFAHVAVK
jgi:peptide/nickel transport system substrate-binding protein